MSRTINAAATMHTAAGLMLNGVCIHFLLIPILCLVMATYGIGLSLDRFTNFSIIRRCTPLTAWSTGFFSGAASLRIGKNFTRTRCYSGIGGFVSRSAHIIDPTHIAHTTIAIASPPPVFQSGDGTDRVRLYEPLHEQYSHRCPDVVGRCLQ